LKLDEFKLQIAGSSAASPDPIRIAGITTRNRPEALKECLKSLAGHLTAYPRELEIIVTDDSDESAALLNRKQLRSIYRDSSYYVGREEKLRLVEKFKHAEIPIEVSFFGLYGNPDVSFRAGANRNCLMLSCAGSKYLSCDDDVIWDVRDIRKGEQNIQIRQHVHSALETWFYQSRSLALDAAPKASADLIAAHEALIGAHLTHIAERRNLHRSLHIDHVGPKSFNHLLDGVGRVLITMSGIIGDSGMPNEFPFFLATGEMRRRFLEVWNGKTQKQRSREVMRGVAHPVIGAGGPIATTTVTGWDARDLLPPFLPVARGEDGVYGYLLRKCYPEGYIGHVPFAVFHAADPSRVYGALPASSTIAQIVAAVLEAWGDVATADPAQRMKLIGRHLVEFGIAAVEDFESAVLKTLRLNAIEVIAACEKLLEQHSYSPEEWANGIKTWMTALKANLQQKHAAVPLEFAGYNAPLEALRRVQQILVQFGHLLQWWPAMVCEAQRSRECFLDLCA
jgi:hypothetical protein